MTENEKRILTLLCREGPLTKRELAERGEMGWSTAVKFVTRLEQEGIVHCIGTEEQPEISGNNPLLYALAERKPLAIGIDVSYATTHVVLVNLKSEILAHEIHATPKNTDKKQFKEFLIKIYSDFAEKVLSDEDILEGLGISMPRWLIGHTTNIFTELNEELSGQLQIPVAVENCIWGYTRYQKWVGSAFSLNDFILLEIRDGVGTGIFYRGELFKGAHGLAGALSHLTIVENGEPCRCGKQGCLETLINQDILYKNYVECVRQQALDVLPSEKDIHYGLAELFSLAQQGHKAASGIVREAACHIGKGIAALLLILDIPHVIIAGDFGPAGTVILPYIEQEVRSRLTPDLEYVGRYSSLEWTVLAKGAPLLILDKFLTHIPKKSL